MVEDKLEWRDKTRPWFFWPHLWMSYNHLFQLRPVFISLTHQHCPKHEVGPHWTHQISEFYFWPSWSKLSQLANSPISNADESQVSEMSMNDPHSLWAAHGKKVSVRFQTDLELTSLASWDEQASSQGRFQFSGCGCAPAYWTVVNPKSISCE